MENVYGIDLGTTYSCIAKVEEGGDGKATVFMNHEGELTTPSVVYFESDSNVVVGLSNQTQFLIRLHFPISKIFLDNLKKCIY